MKIAIVGQGVFGSFLWKEINRVAPELLGTPHDVDIDTIILAVPSSAYESVASEYKDFHLVNVCSTQAKTNWICQKHSDKVTGIHPLFGPRSPKEGRSSIVTLKTFEGSQGVIDLFKRIMDCQPIQLLGGEGMEHDEMMAKMHIPVVKLQAQIKQIMEDAGDITLYDRYAPTSFKKLRDFSYTLGDMPEGTLSSILDNPFYKG